MSRREEPIAGLSAVLSYVAMTGAVAALALPILVNIPGRPRPPESGPAGASSAPSTQASQLPAAAAEPPKDEWPPEEVARAGEQCTHLLASVAAEVERLEPIKKGECGLAAPVRLKSLGTDKKVVFDPPVDISCPMVVALDKWVRSTVQSKAREHLKSEVVGIVRASGYSCRNVYSLPNAKLSQHALANAIDIGGFRLANGRTVGVLNSWGLTERDIQVQAKARAEAEAKLAAAKGAGGAASKAETAHGTPRQKPASPVTQASMTLSARKDAAPTVAAEKAAAPALPPAEPPKPTPEGLFLRAVHSGACKGGFGTVLGPEANEPHRNHFHLDLIPRRGRGICE